MSTDANKAVSRRFWEEVFDAGDLSVLDDILAPGHLNSGPGAPPGLPAGPEGSRQIVSIYRGAFPDLRITVEEQLAEGDRVFTRWSARGTHTGALMGIPASGQSVTVTGCVVDRIAETWGIFDQFGMMQQIGVIPAGDQPA